MRTSLSRCLGVNRVRTRLTVWHVFVLAGVLGLAREAAPAVAAKSS